MTQHPQITPIQIQIQFWRTFGYSEIGAYGVVVIG